MILGEARLCHLHVHFSSVRVQPSAGQNAKLLGASQLNTQADPQVEKKKTLQLRGPRLGPSARSFSALVLLQGSLTRKGHERQGAHDLQGRTDWHGDWWGHV